MAVGHDELKSGKAMPKAKKNDLYFSLELNTAYRISGDEYSLPAF